MTLPAEMRARMIAVNADLIDRELRCSSLQGDVADRLALLVVQLRENARSLCDQLAPEPAPTASGFFRGSNVVAFRR